MKRMRIDKLLKTEKRGFEVTAAGWVRTRRDSKGGFSFVEINDQGTHIIRPSAPCSRALPHHTRGRDCAESHAGAVRARIAKLQRADSKARLATPFAPARQGRNPAEKSDTFTDLQGHLMKAAL